MVRLICLCASLLSFAFAYSQDEWSLEECVAYAVENNISVKQADVQQRLALVNLKETEAGRLPNAGFSTNGGYNFGRSINPATNQFEVNSIFFSNFQLQTSVNVFNWFARRYQIEAGKFDLQASQASLEKARNDIALNVAVAYLQALLAYEQTQISNLQVGLTSSQLVNVRRQVDAGNLPELNALEIESQLAFDSATYIGAMATYQQNLIFLKSLLNLDMARPFEIEKPDISTIPVEPLSLLQPSFVYQEALKNLPLQRLNEYRYQSAQRTIKAARAAMYPSVSAFANIGSRYSSLFPDQQNFVVSPTGTVDTLGSVEIAPGTIRYVTRPVFDFSTKNIPFGRQVFDVNLSQAIGINISIPIFNNRQLRSNWERSKLNAETVRLQLEQDNLVLQQDIYTAYNDAVNARQRYLAAAKAVEAAEKALDFSQKRYEAGLLQNIQLLTNQNNLYRARVESSAARYEFVFRMKLLEFYKGQGLKF